MADTNRVLSDLHADLAYHLKAKLDEGSITTSELNILRQFLKDNQRPDGGFPAESGGKTDAWATAAGIQAILALGEKPEDSFWQAGASTPRTALTIAHA